MKMNPDVVWCVYWNELEMWKWKCLWYQNEMFVFLSPNACDTEMKFHLQVWKLKSCSHETKVEWKFEYWKANEPKFVKDKNNMEN